MHRIPPLLLAGNFLSRFGGPAPIEELADRLRSAGGVLICVSRIRVGWLRSIDLLSTAVFMQNRYRAGVIDLYSGKAFLWGEALSIILKTLGRPFLIVMHGGGLPDFAVGCPRRMRACLERADVVAAPSSYLLEAMRSYRSDIELLPNPLEIGRYEFFTRIKPKPNLVWLRAFHRIYNPTLAPRVLALLQAHFPEINLTMFGREKGDGSLAATKAMAMELGNRDRIRFPGPVLRSDVPSSLQLGDIFLNTTNVDNTPVSVLEAMACGLCVVSTDAGGIRNLLDNDNDSLIVPRNDPEAMAEAVRRILTEPGLAERLSRQARKKAERFDWSAVMPRWLELLARLAPN
jgi:glycosyltransferase involved in cell wall biosynthesis